MVTIFSLPPSKMSQPQPEPNCLAVVSLNCFLKSSKLPKSALICVGDLAGGLAAALGLHDLPEHGVVDVAAAVVLDDLADVFGDAGEVFDELFGRLFADLGVLLDRAVEIGDVGLVVLVVVKLHRRFVDEGLKRRVIVGQRGKFVGHSSSPVVVRCASQEDPDRLSEFDAVRRVRDALGESRTPSRIIDAPADSSLVDARNVTDLS